MHHNKRMLLVIAVALCTTAVPAHAKDPIRSVVALKTQADPLSGDVWHAVQSTWPGTLVFVGSKKVVTLTPVGATPMEATYTFTVKPAAPGKVIEGTLRMTNAAKQVSESSFRIEGKTLMLSFANGQRPEQYVRMTPQEEAAEKAKLEKMIAEGRIRPLK